MLAPPSKSTRRPTQNSGSRRGNRPVHDRRVGPIETYRRRRLEGLNADFAPCGAIPRAWAEAQSGTAPPGMPRDRTIFKETDRAVSLRGEIWMIDLIPPADTNSRQTSGIDSSGRRVNSGPAGVWIVLPLTTRPKGVRSHVAVQPPESAPKPSLSSARRPPPHRRGLGKAPRRRFACHDASLALRLGFCWIFRQTMSVERKSAVRWRVRMSPYHPVGRPMSRFSLGLGGG